MNENLLTLKNFSFCYRDNFCIKNINFSLKKGEILGIIGESGSGKTLLSHAILRLIDKDMSKVCGNIFYKNVDLLKLDSIQNILGKDISYIPQEPLSALNPLHKIGKQIKEIITTHNKNITNSALDARLSELLNLVGLDDSFAARFPYEISGGQRQRALIAMAIANNPQILIADEPTTALDASLQYQILNLLKSLQKRLDIAIILITHNVNIIAKYAHNVVVIHRGEIVEGGEVGILRAPKSNYLKTLISALKIESRALDIEDKIILEAKNLNVSFISKRHILGKNEYTKILSDINFSLKKGSIFGVIGESGSGKSTLALALLNLIKYEGDIFMNGQSYAQIRNFRAERKNIQIVFQDPFSSLNPRHRIKNIICEGLNVHRRDISEGERKKLVENMLECVGLDGRFLERFVSELSGGQRQRIAIARALILNPQILILDEPTSALDKLNQQQILTLLLDLAQQFRLTYILITHDLHIIESLCNEIIVLQNGRIIEHGDAEILRNSQNEYVQKLASAML